MPRAALSVLVVALALGGCVFGDCQFETARAETVGGLVLADGRGVGDTLTVAFVQANVLLDVTVDEGVGETPDRTPDEVVEDARTFGAEKIKVLAVDDDPVALRILVNVLRTQGFDVTFAKNGAEAMRMAITGDFHLVY